MDWTDRAIAALNWLFTNGPTYLGYVIAVSSFLVGATRYPKVSGFFAGLLKVLNALSVLAHHDSPGTFKLPFAQSKPPENGAAVVDLRPPRGAVDLRVLFLVAGLSLLVFFGHGCAAIRHVFGPSFAADEIDCGKDEIRAVVLTVLPDVAIILSGSAPNWQEQLASLEKQGGDAVLCAVRVAVEDLLRTNGAVPIAPSDRVAVYGGYGGADAGTDSNRAFAAFRGQQYLTTTAKKPVIEPR